MGHILAIVALPPTATADLDVAADTAMDIMADADKTGRWSAWRTGGRFQDHFSVAPGTSPHKLLRGPDPRPNRATGGTIEDLDLAAMRRAAVDRAQAAHARWREIDAAAPGALPLSHFEAMHRADPAGCPLHLAHAAHAAQPQLAAAQAESLLRPYTDPVTALADEQQAVTRAAARAVTGFGLSAFLDLDGRWSADPANIPSTAEAAASDLFHRRTNVYIAALDPRCALVAVDLST
ncbi:hypothetical protein [Kitasatospora purpeofusca]|uniref:hypothetical protein n=1 Tax=Kitasatospora purpeofusca TaxID=67352 RepID=UPI0035E02545